MSNFVYGATTAGLANSKGWYIEFAHIAAGRSVRFKAFLTDYNESFESAWSEEKVFGRMDPISTFQGTQRKISLAWDCVAENVGEAKSNMLRCSDLIKMLYPTYEESSASTYSQGQMTASPVLKIKFANLVSNSAPGASMEHLVGTLSGLQYTPDLAAGFVDDASGQLYPKLVRLSTTITVLHTHKLGWDHTTGDWRGGEEETMHEGGAGVQRSGFPWRVASHSGASTDLPEGGTSNSSEDSQTEVEEAIQQADEDAVLNSGGTH
jgi:hypothetical protein